jgi:hypothetical protein
MSDARTPREFACVKCRFMIQTLAMKLLLSLTTTVWNKAQQRSNDMESAHVHAVSTVLGDAWFNTGAIWFFSTEIVWSDYASLCFGRSSELKILGREEHSIVDKVVSGKYLGLLSANSQTTWMYMKKTVLNGSITRYSQKVIVSAHTILNDLLSTAAQKWNLRVLLKSSPQWMIGGIAPCDEIVIFRRRFSEIIGQPAKVMRAYTVFNAMVYCTSNSVDIDNISISIICTWSVK